MSEESAVVVHRRRSSAEISRLVDSYRTSGLGRSEFCRRHGLALSNLDRYLKKRCQPQNNQGADCMIRSPLVEVELATSLSHVSSGDQSTALALSLSNGRRVEVGKGFDEVTLQRLVAAVERW